MHANRDGTYTDARSLADLGKCLLERLDRLLGLLVLHMVMSGWQGVFHVV